MANPEGGCVPSPLLKMLKKKKRERERKEQEKKNLNKNRPKYTVKGECFGIACTCITVDRCLPCTHSYSDVVFKKILYTRTVFCGGRKNIVSQ